jgi:hypothetical protein
VARRVILSGDLQARYEAERLLTEAHPELHVESVGSSHDFVEKAVDGKFDVALLLKAPIAQHQERVHAVSTLRSRGYAGPVLFAGSFLSEREDAAAAGADLVFDPDARRVEELVAAALYLPRLGVDHPYLRFLFVGERVEVVPYVESLPEGLDVVVVSTSCHDTPAFYGQLPGYCQAHPGTACVLVEDGGAEDARVEALSIGVGPHVVLETEGLTALAELLRRELRAAWLRRLRR